MGLTRVFEHSYNTIKRTQQQLRNHTHFILVNRELHISRDKISQNDKEVDLILVVKLLIKTHIELRNNTIQPTKPLQTEDDYQY